MQTLNYVFYQKVGVFLFGVFLIFFVVVVKIIKETNSSLKNSVPGFYCVIPLKFFRTMFLSQSAQQHKILVFDMRLIYSQIIIIIKNP